MLETTTDSTDDEKNESVIALGSEPAFNSNRYELRDGLRTVKPYEHVFETFVKKRWLGKNYVSEFIASVVNIVLCVPQDTNC